MTQQHQSARIYSPTLLADNGSIQSAESLPFCRRGGGQLCFINKLKMLMPQRERVGVCDRRRAVLSVLSALHI